MIQQLTEREILALKNNTKRQEFLGTWKEWSVWGECEPLGLCVRRVGLPDGSYISAAEYKAFLHGNRVFLHMAKQGIGFTPQQETTNQIADKLKTLKEHIRKNHR